MNKLKKYMDIIGRAYKLLLFIVLLEALLWSFFSLLTSLLQKEIINHLLYNGGYGPLILKYGIALGIFVLAIFIAGRWRNTAIAAIGKSLRDRMMQVVLRLNLAVLQAAERDKLLAGITQDTGNFNHLLKHRLFDSAKTITTIAVMAVASAMFDWRFFVLSFLCSLLFALTLPLSRKLEALEREKQQLGQSNINQITTMKENVFLFHFFPGTIRYLGAFAESVKQIARAETAIGKCYSILITLAWGSNMIREMGILLIGLIVLQVDIGSIIALFSITSFMNSAIVVLVNMWAEFQKSYIAAERISGILAFPQEESVSRQSVDSQAVSTRPKLNIDRVTFSYPGTDRGIRELSLELPFGSIVHVKGDIGSGKTTLIKLLSGIYQPAGGAIEIDGHAADLQMLRQLSSVVDQQSVVFPATIAENITLFEAAPDTSKIHALLQKVGMDSWVNGQPAGIDTLLGEGVELSGGQRQRLAICRALYKEAPILIFDEATSALDNENEQLVLQIVRSLKGAKTVFLIDHRERLASISDYVIYCQHGEFYSNLPIL